MAHTDSSSSRPSKSSTLQHEVDALNEDSMVDGMAQLNTSTPIRKPRLSQAARKRAAAKKEAETSATPSDTNSNAVPSNNTVDVSSVLDELVGNMDFPRQPGLPVREAQQMSMALQVDTMDLTQILANIGFGVETHAKVKSSCAQKDNAERRVKVLEGILGNANYSFAASGQNSEASFEQQLRTLENEVAESRKKLRVLKHQLILELAPDHVPENRWIAPMTADLLAGRFDEEYDFGPETLEEAHDYMRRAKEEEQEILRNGYCFSTDATA